MSETISVNIPSDEDGYVLLQCDHCGENFMLKVDDLEDESQLDFWCPNCGLVVDNLLNNEIESLIEKMVDNKVIDILNESFEKLERSSKNSKNIKITGNKIPKNNILPIGRSVGDFIKIDYQCCHKKAKIKSIKKFEGGYCPFCGEMHYGD